MALEWLEILKMPVELILKKIVRFIAVRYTRHKASKKAMQGENLASQGSLHNLVKKELEKLALRNDLPQEFQSDQFRAWLRHDDNVERFVEVIIARAGDSPDISKRAEELLAEEYERVTQETRKLAPGRIELAVSYVYGQITATEDGKKALQLALEQRSAAHITRLGHPEKAQFTSNTDLSRVKAMALDLIEAGKRSWKIPRFIAPLTLEAHERQDDREPHPTDASEIISAIEAGESLVLFGEGGVGKTTFLLDLSTSCLNSNRRIPLYVEAAVWARTNASLLDYLTRLPSARAKDVTTEELVHLAETGRLVIMLNGWNEMAASSKLDCRDGLIHLTTMAQALSFVVASRTSSDVPNLPNAKHIEIRGLTWQGQSAVIWAELGEAGAIPLLKLLAKDTRLRHAGRSPLILRGLIAKARKGDVASSSVFDLLAATVQAFEEDDQRNLVLSVSPVDGYQSVYLEELACFLTDRLTINCSRRKPFKPSTMRPLSWQNAG